MTLYRPCRELFYVVFVLSSTAEAAELPVRVGGPYKLLAADFTGNGHRDLAVGLHDLGMLTIEEGNGEGSFKHLAITPIRSGSGQEFVGGSFNLACGDLDGDGRMDLAVGCMGNFVLLARNTGDGRFESKGRFPTESDAKGVSLVDLDRDGRLDLLYTARGTGRVGDTATGRLYLRRGLGDWRFGDAVQRKAGISA